MRPKEPAYVGGHVCIGRHVLVAVIRVLYSVAVYFDDAETHGVVAQGLAG